MVKKSVLEKIANGIVFLGLTGAVTFAKFSYDNSTKIKENIMKGNYSKIETLQQKNRDYQLAALGGIGVIIGGLILNPYNKKGNKK